MAEKALTPASKSFERDCGSVRDRGNRLRTREDFGCGVGPYPCRGRSDCIQSWFVYADHGVRNSHIDSEKIRPRAMARDQWTRACSRVLDRRGFTKSLSRRTDRASLK